MYKLVENMYKLYVSSKKQDFRQKNKIIPFELKKIKNTFTITIKNTVLKKTSKNL